jgi:hypothetical protein
MAKAISKEFLISEFWRFYNEHGRYPFLKELNKTKGYPSEAGYKRIWNSWDTFLKEIGVIRKDCTDGWYIIDENVLKEKYIEGNKEDILNSLMIKRTWDTIKKKASSMGLKRDMDKVNYSNNRMSVDFLKNELLRYYNEFNHVPTHAEFANNKNYPHPKAFKREFGSWNNALSSVNFELNTVFNVTKKEIINDAVDFFNTHSRSPHWNELKFSRAVYDNYWNTINEMLIEANLPLNKKSSEKHYKTDEELISDYINLYNLLERIPVANDLNINKNTANFSTYVRRFGGYQELWEKCGIENKVILDEGKYGFFCLDKKGEVCKSYAEMIITNLFIDNDIKYEKEYPYKKIIPKFKGKSYVMDWYLPEYEICVEYFGIFREKNMDKNDITGTYARKTIKKINLLKNNNISYIDLYQEDLNQTYLQKMVSKFNEKGIQIKVKDKNLYKNRVV